MKISEARRERLYAAIHEPIIDLRIARLRDGGGRTVDDQLLGLETSIWDNVRDVLRLDAHIEEGDTLSSQSSEAPE